MKINRNEKIHRKISELSPGAVFNYGEEVYMLIVGIDAATQEFNAINLVDGDATYFDGSMFLLPHPNASLTLE